MYGRMGLLGEQKLSREIAVSAHRGYTGIRLKASYI